MMRGWKDPSIPKRGWTCVDTEDLQEPRGTCQMSGTTIRYVHIMTHPQYDGNIEAGCICAGHMEGDIEAAVRRDERMRKKSGVRRRLAARRKNFPHLQGWREASNGNMRLRKDGLLFRVFRDRGRWGSLIKNPDPSIDDVDWVDGRFDTPEDAKLAAFDTWAIDLHGNNYKPGWQGAGVWKPSRGQVLEGAVVRSTVERTKYGSRPLLHIVDDTGMMWKVWCFASKLRKDVEKMQVCQGDIVEIHYDGLKEFITHQGERRQYHDYAICMTRRAAQ